MARHAKIPSGKKGATSANTKSADGESSEAIPAHPDSPTAVKKEMPAGAGGGEEEINEEEGGNDAGSASPAPALEEASAARKNTTKTTAEADASDAAGAENAEPKQAPGPDADTATKAKEDAEKQESETPPVAPEVKTEQKATEDGKQETASPAEAAAAKRKTEAKEQPGASGAVSKEQGGELETKGVVGDTSKARAEEKRPGEDESSDEEDGDGFRIVVGRAAPSPAAPAPAAPAKRFLRGTNTLVNANTTTIAGSGDSRSTPSSKPVSAAAGIASLVPSKGAPVAAARPSLKPGEYPPTAELQQSNGRTAFDVDIDGMEEQPWRHSGVDIADFFNYGFTEESWRVYCEKQLRNRYDQTLGRPKNTNIMGGRGGGGNYMRHGGASGARRGGDSQRPVQLHNSGPERSNFASKGLAGNGWGGGAAPERFAHGFGSGSGSLPGVGHGHASSSPWFDGPSQQMRPGNRQNFGPGPAGVQDGAGSLMRNSNGGIDASAGGRRSLSPDPRGGPGDKRARMR